MTRSRLLVSMAPHVSRFVARLFQIGAEAAAIRRTTSAQDDLFRFKIEFVRRRVWPLAKEAEFRHHIAVIVKASPGVIARALSDITRDEARVGAGSATVTSRTASMSDPHDRLERRRWRASCRCEDHTVAKRRAASDS